MIKLLTDATELVFAINYSCLCYGPISDSNYGLVPSLHYSLVLSIFELYLLAAA